MSFLLFLALVSVSISFLLTPLIRDVCIRRGLVDEPDGTRKLHARPVPRIGGVPIAFAYLASFAVLLLVPTNGASVASPGMPFALRLLPPALVIFATGLLDDVVGLKPWQKLAGQFAAAILAVTYGDLHIGSFLWQPLHHFFGAALTIVWLVGCTNAFNLIDGMDGLATGVGLFATTTTLIAALLSNNVELAVATAPLAAALLGFLRYNFNPASIFLGDSGSLLVGFMLGAFGVHWSQKSATLLGMTAPLIALSIPLLDTALAIARRFLRGQPIFGADRGHIHHKLLARGITVRQAAILMYGFCGIAAALALLQATFSERYGGVVIVLFCVSAWFGIQHLGYAEFSTARRMLAAGAFRGQLNAQLSLNAFVDKIEAAADIESCWDVIRASYGDFGFTTAEACLRGRVYSDGSELNTSSPMWRVTIPISENDWLVLARDFEAEQAAALPASFAERLKAALSAKLAEEQIVTESFRHQPLVALAAAASAGAEPRAAASVAK